MSVPPPLFAVQAVAIGASAGGSAALTEILARLPADFGWPIIVVQHLHPLQQSPVLMYQARGCALLLNEAEDKQPIQPGFVYFAPPNYHLMVDDDRTFALSVDARRHYTRPSIDVLFESAADVYGPALIGIVLSGANQDGAAGLRSIRERGGMAIVQTPASAETPYMPEAAIAAADPQKILVPGAIGDWLAQLDAYYRLGHHHPADHRPADHRPLPK